MVVSGRLIRKAAYFCSLGHSSMWKRKWAQIWDRNLRPYLQLLWGLAPILGPRYGQQKGHDNIHMYGVIYTYPHTYTHTHTHFAFWERTARTNSARLGAVALTYETADRLKSENHMHCACSSERQPGRFVARREEPTCALSTEKVRLSGMMQSLEAPEGPQHAEGVASHCQRGAQRLDCELHKVMRGGQRTTSSGGNAPNEMPVLSTS